jgi:hypothetical protein
MTGEIQVIQAVTDPLLAEKIQFTAFVFFALSWGCICVVDAEDLSRPAAGAVLLIWASSLLTMVSATLYRIWS